MAGSREGTVFCAVRFNCHCNQTQIGDQVCLLGSTAALGKWSFSHRVPLTTSPELYPRWYTERPVLLPAYADVRYKFLICNKDAPLCQACRYEPAASFGAGADASGSARGASLVTASSQLGDDAGAGFGLEEGESAGWGRGRSLLARGGDGATLVYDGKTAARHRDAKHGNSCGLAISTSDIVQSQKCCGAVMKGEWEAAKRWENIRGQQGDRVLSLTSHAVEVFDTFGAEPSSHTVPGGASAGFPTHRKRSSSCAPLCRAPLSSRGDFGPPSAATGGRHPESGCCCVSLCRAAWSEAGREDEFYLAGAHSLPGGGGGPFHAPGGGQRHSSRASQRSSYASSAVSYAEPAYATRKGGVRSLVPPLEVAAALPSPESPNSRMARDAVCADAAVSSASAAHTYFSRLKRFDDFDSLHQLPSSPGAPFSPLAAAGLVAPEGYRTRRRHSTGCYGGHPGASWCAAPLYGGGLVPPPVVPSPLASDSFRAALDSMAAYYPAQGLYDLVPIAPGSSPRRVPRHLRDHKAPSLSPSTGDEKATELSRVKPGARLSSKSGRCGGRVEGDAGTEKNLKPRKARSAPQADASSLEEGRGKVEQEGGQEKAIKNVGEFNFLQALGQLSSTPLHEYLRMLNGENKLPTVSSTVLSLALASSLCSAAPCPALLPSSPGGLKEVLAAKVASFPPSAAPETGPSGPLSGEEGARPEEEKREGNKEAAQGGANAALEKAQEAEEAADFQLSKAAAHHLEDAAVAAAEAAIARLESRLFRTVQEAVCTPRVPAGKHESDGRKRTRKREEGDHAEAREGRREGDDRGHSRFSSGASSNRHCSSSIRCVSSSSSAGNLPYSDESVRELSACSFRRDSASPESSAALSPRKEWKRSEEETKKWREDSRDRLACLQDEVRCLASALFEIRREQAFARQLLAALCGSLERAFEDRKLDEGSCSPVFSSPRLYAGQLKQMRDSHSERETPGHTTCEKTQRWASADATPDAPARFRDAVRSCLASGGPRKAAEGRPAKDERRGSDPEQLEERAVQCFSLEGSPSCLESEVELEEESRAETEDAGEQGTKREPLKEEEEVPGDTPNPEAQALRARGEPETAP
ncbi:hypothetical protein BESB_072120 [Besnoitia besnoiti]|uniref:CBM20 domain-containing protein n=1 Tax=Besnoitia besnoiti TaxID=94643 RepID=A0A2A9MFB0_BESBE|nr:uncharacterized protein BESB_072120 [Besnoitia besnoiti]PFH34060.1 hypothetical protein BESB_072120 [Besnoitia besnoiti]